MESKTKIYAEDGKQDLIITREFDLPLELLFKAYTEPEIIAQWMGTKVLKFENKKHGGWQFETTDGNGNVLFSAHGVIHDLVHNRKIIRTFEMGNSPFGVQLEVCEFQGLTDGACKLNMHVIYESVLQRDLLMKLPFASGLNIAHNRLQDIVAKFK